MPGIKSAMPDSAIRVVVTPSQSSYFAGEPLTVTITFTNTRTADPNSSKALSHTHKRGAHSISSAPLARPPTSPGSPRTPTLTIPPRSRNNQEPPERKGFVGKARRASDDLPDLIEQRRKRLLNKSLSVTIIPREVEGTEGELGIAKSASYTQRNFPMDAHYISPTSPKVPSPLSRSDSLILSSDHPHARKSSTLDGQVTLQEMASPTTTVSSMAFTPNSSTSSFSLALDPISEGGHSPYPLSPSLSSPAMSTQTTSAYLPTNPAYLPRRSTQIGLGLGQPGAWSKFPQPPRTAFSSSFPQTNAELILYSYAQLVGSLYISSAEQSQTLNALRSTLSKQKAVRGGGSMDITSSMTRPPHKRTHSRSSSISSGFMSLLSPTLSTSVSSPPGSASSWSSTGSNPSEEALNPEAPLPTFEVQPAMLAVDMTLLPGESRNYTYTISLPSNLPPTFRGKSLRFTYELVVGTCRAGSPSNISRVMKVPIRMYNHVSVGYPPRPYDLLWPTTRRGPESPAKVVEEIGKSKGKPVLTPANSPLEGSLEDVKHYARTLLESFPGPNEIGGVVRIKLPAADVGRERDEGGLTGCREAVEILTRSPKKASYDVNKDGVKVAVLSFTKSAYRLGETVSGVVEINDRMNRSRVLQLSAMLETQETMPSSLSSSSSARRIHAEHHSSFTLSTLRTTFALDIPSDASPAFQIAGGGGLEWKVRLCLLVAVAKETSHAGTEGVRVRGLLRDGERGEWGTSWSAKRTIAPLEKPPPPPPSSPPTQHNAGGGWAAYLTGALLGATESRYHDGDEAKDEKEEEYDGVKTDQNGGVGVGVSFGGGEDGWQEMKVETVECEVPIKVWPGNTAFKALDIVFDL